MKTHRKEMERAQSAKLRRLGAQGSMKFAKKAEQLRKFASGGTVADPMPGVEGSAPKPRLDRPSRGGAAKKKGTNVNVVIMQHPPMGGAGGPPPAGPMPGPMAMPPHPPMPAPMAGPPPGPMPMPPPAGGPPMRKNGGAVGKYAKGGAVKKKAEGGEVGDGKSQQKRLAVEEGASGKMMDAPIPAKALAGLGIAGMYVNPVTGGLMSAATMLANKQRKDREAAEGMDLTRKHGGKVKRRADGGGAGEGADMAAMSMNAAKESENASKAPAMASKKAGMSGSGWNDPNADFPTKIPNSSGDGATLAKAASMFGLKKGGKVKRAHGGNVIPFESKASKKEKAADESKDKALSKPVRAHGGKVPHMDAGAGSGMGRLEQARSMKKAGK